MSKEKSSKKAERTRYYTFVLYPESAPENFREIIDNNHIAWALSPLHDKDFNGDGTSKKPHWHVFIAFESLKSNEQANEISAQVCGTICQSVHSPRSMVRYFAHLDNPDKAQYSKDDIEAHGGIEICDLLRPTSATKYTVLKEILQYCAENDIREYEDIVIYSLHNEPDWFEALADSCTYMVNSFIKSHRHRKEKEESFT